VYVLAAPIGSHTNTSLPYKCAVLPSAVHPSVPFLAFHPYWGHMTRLCWTKRAVFRCNNSHDSEVYGHATRTNSFQVPQITWGASDVRTVDIRPSSLIFFLELQWMRLVCVYVYTCVQKEGIWDSYLMHSCCTHKPLPLPIQSCSYNGQCMGNKLQEISMWCRFRYGTWGSQLYNDCLANDLWAVMRSVRSSISMYTHLKRSFSMMFCYWQKISAWHWLTADVTPSLLCPATPIVQSWKSCLQLGEEKSFGLFLQWTSAWAKHMRFGSGNSIRIPCRHWHGWHATWTHRTGALWFFCGAHPAHTLKVSHYGRCYYLV